MKLSLEIKESRLLHFERRFLVFTGSMIDSLLFDSIRLNNLKKKRSLFFKNSLSAHSLFRESN